MTVTLDFPPDLETALRERAAQSGQDVGGFVLQAVREKIARFRRFEEVCAPFARAVEAAEVTDEEFDRFFTEVREDVWREKQTQQAPAALRCLGR
ncbi:MAG: hypothetical protein GX575_15860 [Candidatus Anammoximicrobium sp.]|nr:hypothetical protein [Candidatus Anammoximicrobium sp.]